MCACLTSLIARHALQLLQLISCCPADHDLPWLTCLHQTNTAILCYVWLCLQGFDPREGLPKLRQEWVARREARGDQVFTQVRGGWAAVCGGWGGEGWACCPPAFDM